MSTPIILDTDIGDDIDDALALAMVLKHKGFQLEMISTVHAEVDLRARIAAKMLTLWGRPDIPVIVGAGQPYRQTPRTGYVQAQAALVPEHEKFENISTAPVTERIWQTCLRSKAPVTLLAIGPLTNAARTIEAHPDIHDHLERIVLMGGAIRKSWAEYNFLYDPEAARIVMESRIPLYMVPIDITETVQMTETLLQRLMNNSSPRIAFVSSLIGAWQKKDGRTCPVLHDPLAVGFLIEPELYTFEGFDVEVITQQGDDYGVTRTRMNPESKVRICVKVDTAEFDRLFTNLMLLDVSDATLKEGH